MTIETEYFHGYPVKDAGLQYGVCNSCGTRDLVYVELDGVRDDDRRWGIAKCRACDWRMQHQFERKDVRFRVRVRK